MEQNTPVVKGPSHKGLIGAIVFAAVLIAGSIVFYTLKGGQSQLNEENFQTNVSKAIEKYIADQQAAYQKQQEDEYKPKQLDIDYTAYVDDDAVLGDPNAPVTIIEFSDYQCPFCRKFYNETFPELKKAYIDTGKVKLVFRDLPLVDKHPGATPAAIAATCARAQGSDALYFAMHDKIFEGQNELSRTSTVDIPTESLEKYASELDLNLTAFKACMADPANEAEVQKDLADADKLKISATPSFLINNWLVKGAQDFSMFQEVIEKELAGS